MGKSKINKYANCVIYHSDMRIVKHSNKVEEME